MRFVTLVSGGIDSLVFAKQVSDEGNDELPVFVDYGQVAAPLEWAACRETLARASLPAPERIDLRGYYNTVIPPSDSQKWFVPGRNLLLLTVAGALAYRNGAEAICLGLLSEGPSSFPDQSQRFVADAELAIQSALNRRLLIRSPLAAFSKKDVIELALRLSLPISQTYSCQSGSPEYCGACVTCAEILATGFGRLFPQFSRRG